MLPLLALVLCARCEVHIPLPRRERPTRCGPSRAPRGALRASTCRRVWALALCGRAASLCSSSFAGKLECQKQSVACAGCPLLFTLRSNAPAPLPLLGLPHSLHPTPVRACISFVQGQGLARFLIAMSAGVRESLKVLVTGRCASASTRFCVVLNGTLVHGWGDLESRSRCC